MPDYENVNDITAKSTVCVVIAAVRCHNSSAAFEAYLNKLLQLNKLPKVMIGGLPPPVINTKNVIETNTMKDDSCTSDSVSYNIIRDGSEPGSSSYKKTTKTDDITKSNLYNDVTSKKNGIPKIKTKNLQDNLDEKDEELISASESPVAAAVQRLMKMTAEQNIEEGNKANNSKRQLRYSRKDDK